MKALKRTLCLFLCLSLLSAAAPSAAEPPSADEGVEAILGRLTVEQKIAQMLMPAFRQWTDAAGSGAVQTLPDTLADLIRESGIGGVILFAENAVNSRKTASLVGAMQKAALSSESGLPLLVSVDQEGGSVVRLGCGTQMVGNMALGAAGQPEYARQAGTVMGEELAALGFNVDFAPVMDVNVNPANPVIGVRSFSDDPDLVGALGAAMVEGLQRENVSAALKHFPGHGDTATDSHTGLPCIEKTADELASCELIPFAAAIEAGADLVMTAHIRYPKIETGTYVSRADGGLITLPATLSHTMVTGLLREKLGFDGVVCTDAMNMDAIARHFDPLDAACLAINAGVDLLLMPVTVTGEADAHRLTDYIATLADAVRSGRIAEETVDAAVRRILTLKEKRGLLDASFAPADEAAAARAAAAVGSAEHHGIEAAVAEAAVTAVKNRAATLPVTLGDGDSAVLFCAYENEVNAMEYALGELRDAGLLSDGAETRVYCYQNRESLPAEWEAAVAAADAVIASVETTSAAGLRGGWQASFVDALIASSHAVGRPVTVISLHLPYDLARYDEADALLAAYSSQGMPQIPTGNEGGWPTYGPNLPAAVRAVFGAFEPTGTLPVNVPALDASGAFTDEILYPRGYRCEVSRTDPDPVPATDPAFPFTDVRPGDWSREDVRYVYDRGLMKGVSDTRFDPTGTVTRGMLVTVLYRLAGEPTVGHGGTFSDVKAGEYYAHAVAWAYGAGLVSGYAGTDRFGPTDPVTREQIAAILYRYDGYCGRASADPGDTLTGYADADAVSDYARPAMRWATANGLIRGADGRLMPSAPATREAVAALLHRFCEGGAE